MMIVYHKSMGVLQLIVLMCMTVRLGTCISNVLMLMMRAVRVQMPMVNGGMPVLKLYFICPWPD